MFGHFIRIWGRTLGELSLEVRDPVGEGFMHGRAASSMTKSVEHEGSAKPKKEQAELHPKLLRIRPAYAGAHTAIDRVRRENADWLQPWDATLPPNTYGNAGQTLGEYTRTIDRAQRAGRALVMKLEIGGEIAGQFSLTNVTHGAMSSGMLGYWLAEK
ncbi:N-acetyltransferase, partial [Actinomycetaceae bacterium UMB8041B]|nr:N-acetyltransferase [Actinomycetaceae bacterium UMB8041B]